MKESAGNRSNFFGKTAKFSLEMTKLRCRCLNVCIHIKENSQRESQGKTFVSDGNEGNFFSNNLLEVELGVGGITKVITFFDIFFAFICVCMISDRRRQS